LLWEVFELSGCPSKKIKKTSFGSGGGLGGILRRQRKKMEASNCCKIQGILTFFKIM
jgi:hypothetical protein